MTEKSWRNELSAPEFEKSRTRFAPVFANINLLGVCNVDCYFCLGKDINSEFKKHNQLGVHFDKWRNFENFLDRCEEAKIKRLYVTGQNTDSLMYTYLNELVPYLQNERGFEVGLRTNGYLAHRQMDVINQCKRNVGYSIHSLNSESNWKIMHRKDLPNWNQIIPNTKNTRISIVLNRHNETEFHDLLKFAATYDNVKYVQVRRICTDTREDYLLEDVRVYERVFEEIRNKHPQVGEFYGAEVFNIYGKEVCFWRTVKTTIDSFNYYTDGTMTDEYFVIEGYMREAKTYPTLNGIPIKLKGLEGYWRHNDR